MTVPGFILGFPIGLGFGVIYAVLIIQNILGMALAVPAQLASQLLPILTPVSNFLNAGVVVSLLLLLLLFICHVLVVLLPYWLATLSIGAAGGAIVANQGEWFNRGWIMGINWGINMLLLFMLLFGSDPIFYGSILLVQLLAVIPALSASPVLQGFIGWFGWIMPMAWPSTFLGIVIFLLNLICRAVSLPSVTLPANFPIPALAGGTLYSAITAIIIDWGTGCLVMRGGFFTINQGAYNLGNILFVHTSNVGAAFTTIVRHETGHTLNVSSMGSAFHVINAIDENIVQPATGFRAYGEMAAESHRRAPGSPFIDLW